MRTPLVRSARRRHLLVVGCAGLLLTVAGCGGGEKAAPPPATPTSAPVSAEQLYGDLRAAAATAPATAAMLAPGLASAGKLEGQAISGAAELRAALNAVLVEHVQLTVLAARADDAFGAQSPFATAAVTALQANGSALADLVGRAEERQREPFATAWGQRITAELAYAAAPDGDAGASARQTASAALLANSKTLGQILSEASDEVLSTAAVQKDFVLAATRLTAALDGFADNLSDTLKEVRSADDQAGDLAATLAAGLDRASELDGDPSSAAAGLRAELAGLLTESTYLTGLGEFFVHTDARQLSSLNPRVDAAFRAADVNAQSLATVVGAGIGRDRQAEFIALWREYLDDLAGYGSAGGDAATTAGARLAGFPAKAGSFLAGATQDALPAADATAALDSAVQAMLKALESMRSLRDVPLAAPDAAPAVPVASPEPSVTESPSATEPAAQTESPSVTESPNVTESPSSSASATS